MRSNVELADLPASVNWTAKGYTTPVKNQKACGSCWAFSSTGSLEGQWFKKYKKLVSLSEQNLVDCSAKTGKVCKYNATNKGANLTSWVDIPTGSEQDLQKAVATIGPVSVGIDAHLPTFQHY